MSPSEAPWEEAAARLADDRVVGLPTDTVYGIAARIDRPGALQAVFEIKERPETLALPVLVADVGQAQSVAAAWPPAARALAGLWPGALTLVVPAADDLAAALGAAEPSVGLRCPDHDRLRALCQACGPLAVTSANRHGQPPCTTASDVVARLGVGGPPGLALVVDGGPSPGIPSTVVDCRGEVPVLVRSGAIGWDAVRRAAGPGGPLAGPAGPAR